MLQSMKSISRGASRMRAGQGICRRAPRIFIEQGRFSEARAQFVFVFQVSSDKLRARMASLDLRVLKVYNTFNGTKNFESYAF